MGDGAPVSGCVISYQEADRIEDCLRSLSFCDDLVVVDSGSTDGTVDRAAALGARVVHRPFAGHREQKQFAVDQARHDRVFCLDADERCTPELQQRIGALRAAGFAADAYEMPRRNHYLGRIMRHGLSSPDRKVRLFDRRRARWGGRNPHDRVVVDTGATLVRLAEPIEHLSYRDLRHHLRTIDSFSRIAADAMFAEGQRASLLDQCVRPPAVFVKSLLVKLGLLDGWRGVLFAALAGYTDWRKYGRLRRLAHGEPS